LPRRDVIAFIRLRQRGFYNLWRDSGGGGGEWRQWCTLPVHGVSAVEKRPRMFCAALTVFLAAIACIGHFLNVVI
jgi:hypothetical protein